MPRRVSTRLFKLVGDFERRDAEGLAEIITDRFGRVTIEPARTVEQVGVLGTYGAADGIDFSRMQYSGALTLIPQRHHDGFFFFIPTTGAVVVHEGRHSMIGSPTMALAVEGPSCRSMQIANGHAHLSLVIHRMLLTERLSVLLGRAVTERPVFEASVAFPSGQLGGIKALLACITDPEFAPALNQQGFVAARLHEMLIDIVLEAWPNTYSETLLRPPPPITPRHVKLAIDFLRDHPQSMPTGAELARLSGVSLRSLQAGFRRFLGLSIIDYQRRLRLERAREDLLSHTGGSVEDIALRWGFTNAGRFTRYFKQAYGEFPASLVRRRR